MERDEELKDFKTMVSETIDEFVKEKGCPESMKETTKTQHVPDKELSMDDIIEFASNTMLNSNNNHWISLYDIINAVVTEKLKDLDKGDEKPSDVKQKFPMASGYYDVTYRIFNPDGSYYHCTTLARYYKETNLWRAYDRTISRHKHEVVSWCYPEYSIKTKKTPKTKKKEKWIRDRFPKASGYYKIQYRNCDDNEIIFDTRIAYFMHAHSWCKATTLNGITYTKDLYNTYYNSRVIGWKHIDAFKKEETK